MSAAALLRRNLWIYGVGGIVVPFIGIKLIDMLITRRAAGVKSSFTTEAQRSRRKKWKNLAVQCLRQALAR